MSDTQTQTKGSHPEQRIEIRNTTRSVVRLSRYDIAKDGAYQGQHDDDIVIGDKADEDIPDEQRTAETPSPRWRGTRGELDSLPKAQRAFLDALIEAGDLELREI